MPKKITFVVILVIFLVILYSLGKQIADSLQAGGRLNEEAEELVRLQRENSTLKKKLAESESVSFIEEEARNKLNFAREGESIVLIPQEEIDKVIQAEKTAPINQEPNWRGWLRLFWK